MQIQTDRLQMELDKQAIESKKQFQQTMERNKSYQELSGKFHEHLCDTTVQLAKFKGETSDMLIEMNSKLKFIKEFRE